MAIAIQDDFASAYYNRGNALANLQRLDEAIENYMQVVRLEGGDAPTFYNVALAYDEKQDYRAAADYFRRAVDVEEFYEEPSYCLGCTHDALRRYEGAVACFGGSLALE